MKTRARDPLYDAWTELWGEPTTATERGRLNRALKELRDIDASPDDVRRALRNYDREFQGCTRSPQGVTGNWTMLASKRPAPGPWGMECQCPHGVSVFERCPACLEEA